jgi:cell division septum initiation protein DivIVA
MTDKEFKRLSRFQLIDIIYQLQLKQEELIADNEALTKALDDKRIQVSKAGNIAEAALEIHNVMQAAQDAASHYLEEMQIRIDQEYQRILQKANDNAAAILEKAKQEAKTIVEEAQQEAVGIVEQARSEGHVYDPVVDAILKEYGIES